MIRVENLRKCFGKHWALNGMDFSIGEGEIYGFVGPNGAGKTTTMRIMAGLMSADEGAIWYEGENLLKQPKKLRKLIGYMPDFFGVYDNLKVIEYMEFFASVYGCEEKGMLQECRHRLEMVCLEDKEEMYVDTLSRGMKQRLCLARCLLVNPKLLILDEPASGMDPGLRMEFREILRNLAGEGTSILISSHILGELSELCTNIGIVSEGKTIASGTIGEIMEQFDSYNPIVLDCVLGKEEILNYLKENPLVETISIQENKIFIGFSGSRMEESKMLQEIHNTGALIASYGRTEGNLESLFMQLTKKDKE